MIGNAPRFGAVVAQDPRNFAPLQEPGGRDWLRHLPALVKELCRRWRLILVPGDVQTGYHAVVLPVRRGDEDYVLKIAWPADRTGAEVKALSTWRGRGAVLLLDADVERGALLLERLDANRTLNSVCLREAAAIAGGLLSLDPRDLACGSAS